MFALIGGILEAVRHEYNFRTLRGFNLVLGRDGKPQFSTGNNAVVFRVVKDGREYAMRCYRRTKPYLKELYGEAYYPDELSVSYLTMLVMVDVVLCDWVEGSSLSRVVRSASQDQLRVLAERFDELALWLINEPWAHGDLSPDNIIVGEDGCLHLIDLDARYIPSLEGCASSEVGTSAYNSTGRTSRDFGPRIDDFAIGVISCSLHALSLEPQIKSRFPSFDGLLFDAQKITSQGYEVVSYMFDLFARSGDFVHYRILKLLQQNKVVIEPLPELLSSAKQVGNVKLELYISWGFCGYCDAESGEVVIPPLYDEAFEFRGDFALVRLSKWWFYIDKSGCVVESCGECSEGKPSKIR